MIRHIGSALFLAGVLAAIVAAADNPFAGKWKLNPDKSTFTGETESYEHMPSGEIKYTSEGMSYTFKTDGQDRPALLDRTAAWKQIDKSTWEATFKMNGKVLATDTLKVSSDGKTLTEVARGTKPNGEKFEDTTVYERTGAGAGLLGAWKSTKVKIGSPNLFQFTPYGTDGLTLDIVDYKATCKAKFDGKDYPATGPTVPAGLTLALTRKGPRSFQMLEKVQGKALSQSTFTVSQDGKILTEVGRPVAVDEPYTAVYEKQ